MTYRELMEEGSRRLEEKGIENSRQEIRELMGCAMGMDCRSFGFGEKVREPAQEPALGLFSGLLERRLSGEPLQYLLGEWEFYGLTFRVGRGVLIPRQDTELIVETAEKLYNNSDSLNVIDLCAGTGCIGIALEKRLKGVSLRLVEGYEPAAEYLRQNLSAHSSSGRAYLGDVLDESLADRLGQEPAELIVCNPPYLTREDMGRLQTEVCFEPETALFGGEDGLDFYRGIVRIWRRALRPGGRMIFEIGAGQEDEVMQIMTQLGFVQVRSKRDARGIFRCVYGEFEG